MTGSGRAAHSELPAVGVAKGVGHRTFRRIDTSGRSDTSQQCVDEVEVARVAGDPYEQAAFGVVAKRRSAEDRRSWR